jgi:hypothetical protein
MRGSCNIFHSFLLDLILLASSWYDSASLKVMYFSAKGRMFESVAPSFDASIPPGP